MNIPDLIYEDGLHYSRPCQRTRLPPKSVNAHKEHDIQHTILTEDSLEAEHTQLRAELRRGGTEHVVLYADGECRDNSDDEEVESVAVAVMATLVGVYVGEAVDGLTKDDTKGRIYRSGH